MAKLGDLIWIGYLSKEGSYDVFQDAKNNQYIVRFGVGEDLILTSEILSELREHSLGMYASNPKQALEDIIKRMLGDRIHQKLHKEKVMRACPLTFIGSAPKINDGNLCLEESCAFYNDDYKVCGLVCPFDKKVEATHNEYTESNH